MSEEESPEDMKKSVLAHNIELQFWDIIKKNMESGEELDNYDQMGCCVIAIMKVLHGLTEVIKKGTEKNFKFKDMLETIEGMHSHFITDKE